MEPKEAKRIWVQRTQETRKRFKESGLTPDEYCEQQQKEIEAAKESPWKRFIRWLGINV